MIPPPPRSTLFPYTTLFRSYLAVHMKQLRIKIGGTQVIRIMFSFSDIINRCFIAHPPVHRLATICNDLCQCRCPRSEEHTSELQSRQYLVCRLLLEKKKKQH